MEMVVCILQALEYAHRSGIVHHDIKPSNVMPTRSGQVKVMDFGIARSMRDADMTFTETSEVVGTVAYLSPEQAMGEKADARSDLYSAGCLLYELLADRPPFIGDYPAAVTYHHVHEEPKAPSAFSPAITPEMDAIVLKALAKDPGDRYQSADEMRADIEGFLKGRPIVATAAVRVVDHGEGRARQAPAAASASSPDDTTPTSPLPPVDPDDSGDGSGDRTRRGRRRRRKSRAVMVATMVAGLLALAGVLVIGRWAIDDSDSNRSSSRGGGGGRGESNVAGETVVTPGFVGETRTAAERTARQSGVELVFAQRPCGSQNSGRICEQDPAPGTKVAKGSAVNVAVSTGKIAPSDAPKLTVPRVIGLSVWAATAQLEAGRYAFDVRTRTRESSEDAGTALEQVPSAGAEVGEGSTITIVVAEPEPGAQPDEQQEAATTVPDVTGLTCAEAEELMTAYGLVGYCTERQTDDPEQIGKVISTTPGKNQQADRHSAVEITIGSAAPKEQVAGPRSRRQVAQHRPGPAPGGRADSRRHLRIGRSTRTRRALPPVRRDRGRQGNGSRSVHNRPGRLGAVFKADLVQRRNDASVTAAS